MIYFVSFNVILVYFLHLRRKKCCKLKSLAVEKIIALSVVTIGVTKYFTRRSMKVNRLLLFILIRLRSLLSLLLFVVSFSGFSADFYWVGGSGNWTDAAHWSNASGGSGGIGIPSDQDNAIIDANSFDQFGEINFNANVEVKDLDGSGIDEIVLLKGNTQNFIEVSGDFRLNNNVNFLFEGDIILKGAGNNQIDLNGVLVQGDVFIESGQWELENNLSLANDAKVLFTKGGLNTNGHRLMTGSFITSGNDLKTLNVGNSKVDVKNQWEINGNVNFIENGAQILLSPNMAMGDIVKGPAAGANYRVLFECANPVNTNDTLYIELLVTSDYNGFDISCNGLCDAEVTVNASSTTGGPFSYSFQGGPFTNQTIYPGLCVGNKSITVIDSSQILFSSPDPVYFQCTRDINVNEPSIIALDNELAISAPSCPDSCDGVYLVTASGGAGAYTYSWSNGESGANPTQLCTGTNTVTITDQNGCTFEDSIQINDPTPIYPQVNTQGVSCFGVCDGYAVSNPTGGNGGPYSWDWQPGGETTDSIGSQCAGNYDLTVYDVDGCPKDTTVTITTPIAIDVTLVNQVNLICHNQCIGELEVTATDGTAPYSYQWYDATAGTPIVGETNALVQNLCAGDYYVEVTDFNGCSINSSTFTITEPTPINPTISVNDVLCAGDCNGTGTTSASGGTPGYNFEWFDLNGPTSVGTGTNINTLCAGDYYVEVTDNNSCVVQSDTLTVNEPTPVTTSTTQTDILCNGQCTGEITVTPAGGVGGYTYEWLDASQTTIPGETNPTIQNLCAGDYYAVVTDANGCDDTTAVVTITEPPAIDIQTTVTEIQCNGDCSGEITATVTGGVGPYNLQWFDCNTSNPIPGETNLTISGLCAGSYYLQVTDANGCVIDNLSNCDVLNDPPQLTITLDNTTDASCGGFCDGSATATVTGGTGATNVDWYDNVGDVLVGSGTTFGGFCTGNFYGVVADANGCSDTTVIFNITDAANVTGNLTTNDATCFGFCDGSASIVAAGGTPPYTYEWVAVPSGVVVGSADNVSGLCAGDYTVEIFDVNLCSSGPIAFTIDQSPQLTATLNSTDASCNGDCDGTASITVNGGVPGYNYNWSPGPGGGQGTPNASGLCADTYTVTVTDNIGCVLDTTVTITEPTAFDLTVGTTDETCAGDCDGTATVTVNSGGTSGYNYNWVPAPGAGQGTPNATNMCPGAYDLTITDVTGCDTTITVTITGPTALSVNAAGIADNLCFGDCNGTAEAVVSGGTPGYNYSWAPGGQSTATATGLCAGGYTVTVTDANGCVDTDNVTIAEPNTYDINTSFTDAQCNGVCDGTATVTVNSGGTPPYNYSWNDPFNQTTSTATGLCAGNYDVTVSDANGCDTVISFTISEPTVLSVPITNSNSSCFGQCSGSATVTPAGGTAPYSVTWVDANTGIPSGITTETANGLCPGDYYALVEDANGCTETTATVSITEDPEIIWSETHVDATCTVADGSATITASGGSGSFVNYTWTPVPGGGQGTPNATGLSAGVYTVLIEDSNGCTETAIVNISNVPIEVVTMDSTDATCYGGSNGTATANVTCSDPPCTFDWYDDLGNPIGQTTSTAIGLSAGIYSVEVTNASGCITIESIEVGEGNPIDVTGTLTDPICNGDCDGEVDVTVSGGTGGFNYNWSPAPGGGQGTSTATGLCSGNYQLIVEDASGCDTTVSYTLNDNPVLDVSNTTSNDISCFGANDGTATVFPTGGVQPVTYEWFDCASGTPIGQTGQQATGLGPGSYYVEVTDQAGCTQATACVDVLEPNQLTGSLSSTNVICANDCDGTASVVVAGGTPNYIYDWTDGSGASVTGGSNANISGLCPDNYSVEVTDNNGCVETFGPVTITEPNILDVSVSTTDATCNGGTDGEATITINSGGTPPFNFTWSPAPGTGQGAASVTGLAGGDNL